jgi:hypothetical protein
MLSLGLAYLYDDFLLELIASIQYCMGLLCDYERPKSSPESQTSIVPWPRGSRLSNLGFEPSRTDGIVRLFRTSVVQVLRLRRSHPIIDELQLNFTFPPSLLKTCSAHFPKRSTKTSFDICGTTASPLAPPRLPAPLCSAPRKSTSFHASS